MTTPAPAAEPAPAQGAPMAMIRGALACFALSALGLAGGLAALELAPENTLLVYGGFALCVGAGLAAHVLAIWGWVRWRR